MIKISAGYSKVNPNFVIQNLGDKQEISEGQNQVCAILHNILCRGCPTIPSKLIRDFVEYKGYDANVNDDFVYWFEFSELNWSRTIKGGTLNKPALYFYREILPNIFGDLSKTFIPEHPLQEFFKEDVAEQYIDLYSPILDIAIEIDGSQHTIKRQIEKDLNRESIFKDILHIPLIRIKTKEIDDYTKTGNIDPIKSLFRDINSVVKDIIQPQLDNPYENQLLCITRFEQLLFRLFEYGLIKFTGDKVSIGILLRKNVDLEPIAKATESILNWIENIALITNTQFLKPNIDFITYKDTNDLLKHKGIKIDISLYQTYSEPIYKDIIYIRNDYFRFSQYDVYGKDPKRNYFKFAYSNSDIEYKLSKQRHSDIFIKLLNDMFVIDGDYLSFKENQLEIIMVCLNEKSVFEILPVGSGKSLCYQLCSLLIPKNTLCISPLRVLMDDQHDNIVKLWGITNSTVIYAGNKAEVRNMKLDFLGEGKSIITIISPERFFNEKFMGVLKSSKINIGNIVVDEVHCLSEWGHDFRTSYLCLMHNLKKYFHPQKTYLMALTGTASPRVYQDIQAQFKNFKSDFTTTIKAESMKRDNLKIIVEKVKSYYDAAIPKLLPVLEGKVNDKILVFTRTKQSNPPPPHIEHSSCVLLYQALIKQYPNILDFYSGGNLQDEEKKKEILKEFKKKEGKLKIILATKAFGMGVDIPDIHTTIHYGLPGSLVSLYQEIGRAGRNKKLVNMANCYVLYKEEDELTLDTFFKCETIEKMADYEKGLRELGTGFYFIKGSYTKVNVEIDIMSKILNVINRLNSSEVYEIFLGGLLELIDDNILDTDKEVMFSKGYVGKQQSIDEQQRVNTEKILYRLFLLNEIEMWAYDYSNGIDNPKIYNLKIKNISDEDKLILLEQYIKRYDSRFEPIIENSFTNRAQRLLQWTIDNFLKERIQSLKTIYESCRDYKSPEDFMDKLNQYLTIDNVFVRLIEEKDSEEIDLWFDVIKMQPNNIQMGIARLLESYHNVTGLNFVSGISRLLLNDFDNPDGKRRLEHAIDDISLWDETKRRNLFLKTHSFLNDKSRDAFDESHVALFIESWLRKCNKDALWIYKVTKDKLCEFYLFMDITDRLSKISEILVKKLWRTRNAGSR